ncbi:hypothetical protein GcM1_224061, partial [Golovinomyces cichoracearum]
CERSLTVVHSDCRLFVECTLILELAENGVVQARKSPIEKYTTSLGTVESIERPCLVRNLTLIEWLRFWDWNLFRQRPREKFRASNYYPNYPLDPDSPNYGDDCHAYMACSKLLTHPDDHLKDVLWPTADKDTENDNNQIAPQYTSDSQSHPPKNRKSFLPNFRPNLPENRVFIE